MSTPDRTKLSQSLNSIHPVSASRSSSAEAFVTELLQGFNDFGVSGPNHSPGVVPDPGPTQGNTRFLREDGWAVPGGIGGLGVQDPTILAANTILIGNPATGRIRSFQGGLIIEYMGVDGLWKPVVTAIDPQAT